MWIDGLVAALYAAKQAEEEAKARRVALEADLAAAIGLPDDWEGSKTNAVGAYKVKLTRRMNVKIDPIKLRELARVNNILPTMERCFRWKPEIVKKEWDKADERARTLLAPAMEITPGKASFVVSMAEEETA